MNELEYGINYYERGVISPEEFIDMYLQPEVKKLQKQNAEYRKLIKEAVAIINTKDIVGSALLSKATHDLAADNFRNRPEVKQILEEGE